MGMFLGNTGSTQDHVFQEIHPQELFKASKGTKKTEIQGPGLIAVWAEFSSMQVLLYSTYCIDCAASYSADPLIHERPAGCFPLCFLWRDKVDSRGLGFPALELKVYAPVFRDFTGFQACGKIGIRDRICV